MQLRPSTISQIQTLQQELAAAAPLDRAEIQNDINLVLDAEFLSYQIKLLEPLAGLVFRGGRSVAVGREAQILIDNLKSERAAFLAAVI